MTWSDADPEVVNCRFLGNFAAHSGGGLYNNNNSHPTIANCFFSGNQAAEGGGLANFNAPADIINTAFVANSASYLAGGATNGTGPFQAYANCIFWGNKDNYGSGEWSQLVFPFDLSISVNHCCIEDLPPDVPGVGNFDSNPLFVDADGDDDLVGTMDDDLHLVLGSPCIESGDNSFVVELLDLDGNERIYDSDGDGTPVVDLGPFEHGSSPPQPDIPTMSSWGLVLMTLIVLVIGTTVFPKRDITECCGFER